MFDCTDFRLWGVKTFYRADFWDGFGMVDRQGQDLTTVDLTESQLQQVQAGENAVSFQNSDRNWVLINNVVNKSFFGFGGTNRAVAGQDDRWDLAARVLEMQLTQIRTRLTDVLLDDRLLMIDAEERLDFVGRSPLASMRELKVGRSVETVNPDRLMIEMFERKDVGGKLLTLGDRKSVV